MSCRATSIASTGNVTAWQLLVLKVNKLGEGGGGESQNIKHDIINNSQK